MIRQESFSDNEAMGKRYDRRAKVAAWAAGVTGITLVSMESSRAEPAAAAIEESASYELLSPRQFVTMVDSRLVKLQKDIKAEPDVEHFVGDPIGSEPDARNGAQVYIVSTPNPENPKHVDYLAIETGKKTKRPIRTHVFIDVNPKQNVSKTNQKKSYTVNWPTRANKVSMSEDFADREGFSVYTASYSRYETDPAKTIKAYNSMFAAANRILKANS